MVMETPSPQCVGHEFVRQYYTILNKAPSFLHRFYSNNSLFMHGGPSNVNDPTVGQENIHQKILSLNFQDCHAKIRMVDAHATLGCGVVIQVTGELSNNGMPMRRFMQTFVLAPQAAKKYYVHNDIFRYQDEVFSDDEVAEESSSEPEEELETSSSGIVEGSSFTGSATVNGNNSHHTHHREPEPTSPIPTPTSTPTPAHIQSPSQVTPTPTTTPLVAPQVPVTPPSSTSSVTSIPVAAEPKPSTPPTPQVDGWGSTSVEAEDWGDNPEESVTQTLKKESAVTPPTQAEPSPPVQQQPVSNEPKTYANLFKNSSGFTHIPAHTSSIQSEPSIASQSSYSSQMARPESSTVSAPSRPSGPMSGSSVSGSLQSQTPGGNLRPTRTFHDEEKRRAPVPDSQQVFVGNLPHSIGEEELRNEFQQYGKILEIRINTGKGKTASKGPGHQVPNFGFIAFDDEEAVVRCLNSRPIYLNRESRINVEEKKARSRVESTGGMIGGGRPTSGGGGRGMGPSGGMRGGQGGMMPSSGRGGVRGPYGRGENSRGGAASTRGGGFIPRR